MQMYSCMWLMAQGLSYAVQGKPPSDQQPKQKQETAKAKGSSATVESSKKQQKNGVHKKSKQTRPGGKPRGNKPKTV